MFEPSALGRGPSGLADLPRPFVFRASHLDGSTVNRGVEFSFDLNLFDMRNPAVPYFVLAFGQLAREGLGPRRGRADLISVWRLNEDGETAVKVFNGNALLECGDLAMQVDLDGPAEPVDHVCVRFVTPTELKAGKEMVERPEFAALAARIRDRLSTLRSLYDGGPLEIDFRGFGERAARVRMTECNIHRVEATRQSTRAGQVHSIGGFIGEAEYEGDLAEFVPFLRAAKWTGVGRQTGRGCLRFQFYSDFCMSPAIQFVGDPFVDTGAAVLEYRLDKACEDFTESDLASQANELVTVYSRPAWIGYLTVHFPNSCWCNATMGQQRKAAGECSPSCVRLASPPGTRMCVLPAVGAADCRSKHDSSVDWRNDYDHWTRR